MSRPSGDAHRRVAERVIVEADGGSRGNPGPAGYGTVVLDADTGEVLAERQGSLGIATNNVAEYEGLIAGLTAARELGSRAVRVRMDSKLVIEQMSGRWQVKHPSIRPLADRASQLAGEFAEVSFEWIPRAQNSRADRLANQAMDAAAGRSEPDRPVNDSGPTPQSAWVPPCSTATRLLLVRHGVTAYSIEKRFAGRSDLDLTDEGREQARRVAARIAESGSVDAIVSSPLLRTRHTAEAIAAAVQRPVAVSDGFVETDFGEWDGYTFAEVGQRWPGELKAWMADPSVAPPGGESFEAVTRRVRSARDRLIAQHRGQTVVVVSHVTPIKILVRLALDAPPAALHRMLLGPASISAIDYFDDGPVSLRSFNESAHL